MKYIKRADPKLYKVYLTLRQLELLQKSEPRLYFKQLCESIIQQQLSVKAGATIFKKFTAVFQEGKVTPQNLLKIEDQKLRQCGISFAKIKYLKDLAQKTISGVVDLQNLDKLDDEAVVEELIKVKGIGRWTAEMFLMFSLGREDIFSHGDLGLRNALKNIYGLEKKEEIEILVQKWSPYRTYACRILWRSLKNEPTS